MNIHRDTGMNVTYRYVSETRRYTPECTDVYEMQTDFEAKVESEFSNMIDSVTTREKSYAT